MLARTPSFATWFLTGALAVGATSAHAQGVRTEIHPLSTVTLTEPEFLTGSASGTPATIAGELRLPRVPGRVPAVVLVHGSGGVGSNIGRWAQELNGAGFATFALDSFSGRGITETATDQAQLSHVGMIVDAYRALARLATHPRIDPARIAVMGFSKGGFVALYASLTRFQRMHAPPGLEFAAYVPFYPICIRTYIDDGQVSTRPIRIFHGGADDWLPIAACRQYVDRLRQAGKDIQLTEYAGAQHGFDNPTSPPTLRLPNVQAGPDCRLEERAGGQMVFRDTGQPFAAGHPCVRRGATIGYDPEAHRLALDAVKAFLASALKAAP
jgi:dienelactone hydrolase